MRLENGKRPYFRAFMEFIKRNYVFMILLVATFLAGTIISYFNIATWRTVSTYDLDDFEIGQIADRTIYANKTLPADADNPVAIEAGEKIIRKGFAITEEEYNKLRKMAESPDYIDYRAYSNSLLFLFLLAVLWVFLFSPVLLKRKVEFKEMLLYSLCFLLVYAVVAFAGKAQPFSTDYSINIIIPASFCTLIAAILFGQLSAVFLSLLLSLCVLNATGFELLPTLFTFASCLSSVRIMQNIERRIDMVIASLLLSVIDVVCIIALKVIFNDSFADSAALFAGVAFNGFISGILALGFLTPLESLLNTASVFRLMDLSDLNNPLMRRMLLTAAGTYNHSILVASLAENACKRIGANALLARVGAYYHDIGKMDQPEYFVENQKGENKHDEINPSLSASVIRSHVKKGLEKARSLHLPQQVIDIIAEHHGNSVIAYFYNEAREKDPSVNPEDFSYTGMPPSSKESAVVMLADTAEAACRTLDKPSVPRLDKFIRQLINAKVEHGQLDNCGLTFRDISVIKDSFVQILAGYYHSRIEYPEQKELRKGDSENREELGQKTLDEIKKI
ncbi:MAG: HDIG domain-containing protein [Treponema sp.]|nr:HDIG domain-containing protein [Treponema sp.]